MVYLESSGSTMQVFCGNSERLKSVNFFRKKVSLFMFEWVLNTPMINEINVFFFK